MRHVRKTVTWSLALVTSLLLLAFLTGDGWHGGDKSAEAADSQPAVAMADPGAGPQQVGCIVPWPVPLGDEDCDGFSHTLELHVGTNPISDCGPGAWPSDINDDGSVDVIGDLTKVTANFGLAVGIVPGTAPVRYDVGPEPAGDLTIDVIGDLTRITAFFGQHCS